MSTQQPPTQTIEISDFRKESRVVIEQSGMPMAVLVSTDDLARLDEFERCERERAERFAVIDEMRQAFAGVPVDEIERETDRITADIRSQNQYTTAATAR